VTAPPAFPPGDLAGRWIGSSYTCQGTEPDELIEITYSDAQGLIATKVNGDACVHESEVTWRGRLEGQTIKGEMYSRGANAPVSSGSWQPGTFQVISRNEIRAFEVRYHRGDSAANDTATKGCHGFVGDWSGWMGLVKLRAAGNAVTGTYGNNGSIEGTISGDILTGRAFQPGVPDSYGSIRLKLSPTGKEFSGRWTQDPANGSHTGDFSAHCQR
jgi:hypothetical protein